MTAGQRLRDDIARALAHAVRDAGRPLEFDERETRTIERAARALASPTILPFSEICCATGGLLAV
jgi:hypothetical protein